VPEVEVVALADLDRAALEGAAREFRIPRRYPDADELIADPELDAVAVCVPASGHAEIAAAALAANRHVLVEKPLALSLGDADRLIAAAERSAGCATVGFNMRFHRVVQEAVLLVRAGAIGRVSSVRGEFTDPLERPAGIPAWRLRPELGGGPLFEKAVHHFDLWRHLLSDEVEEVFARGEDDLFEVAARTRRGALASVLVSDSTSVANRLELRGDRGSLAVDCYRSDGLVRSSLAELPGAPRTRLRRAFRGATAILRGASEIRRGGPWVASYDAEWRHFAAAARTGATPAIGLLDGRRALELVLAAARSADLGEPVRPDRPLVARP
jgi:myo-inositol 2-dehydrogenase / D-chiro-inositol 1-dehydrogenase